MTLQRERPRSPAAAAVRVALTGALAEALALLLPVACAGCGEHDISLCEACEAALVPVPEERAVAGAAVPVWSGLRFEGAPARVIRTLKEDGRTGLARSLAPALAAAARAAGHADEVLIVPVPTSRAAYRRRGFRVVELIARRARLPVARALVPTRRVADQRGLDRDQRRRNVAGSMIARGVTGCRVIVVDDVVTTGATLAEAMRALRAGGAEVVGAAVVAATARRSG